MLIVLRGNSGSGKSTTARLLREAAIENGRTRRIALVEQDYLRRIVLQEKESEGADNISLIYQTVAFALEHGYDVILEGILRAERYENMLLDLHGIAPSSYFYYFDIPLEETLIRHGSKPNAHEFGEQELSSWYKPNDTLGFTSEKIIDHHLGQQQIVDMILTDTNL